MSNGQHLFFLFFVLLGSIPKHNSSARFISHSQGKTSPAAAAAATAADAAAAGTTLPRAIGIALVSLVCLYILSFSIGWGPIPWGIYICRIGRLRCE